MTHDQILTLLFNNLSLILGALVVWYRLGRNAEKVFSDLKNIGDIVKSVTSTLDGIKELLTRHDVKIENVEKEIARVEHQCSNRFGRVEDKMEERASV